MSLTRLANGLIVDPATGRDRAAGDLYIGDGRIVADPGRGARIDHVIDIGRRIVMPGGIDIHSHIAGGKIGLARSLMLEEQRRHPVMRSATLRSGSGGCTPSSFATGYRYAQMGYTAAFEPAAWIASIRAAMSSSRIGC